MDKAYSDLSNQIIYNAALWEVTTAQITVYHTDESVVETLILNGHYTDLAVSPTMIYQCC